MKLKSLWLYVVSLFIIPISFVFSTNAQAGGRILATGGVTQIEGNAGGGLVPWALIAGLGTRDEVGGTVFFSQARLKDFQMFSTGFAVGFYDRFELSYARQRFDLQNVAPGDIEQDVIGMKLKIMGDAVFDQDKVLPQIALGIQIKNNHDFAVPSLLGARHDSGIDLYLAASKVYLAGLFGRNLLLNGTLRVTKANQYGILGFGGDLKDSYSLQFESSIGVFLKDHLVVGTEFRSKPDNLSSSKEDNAYDLFLTYFLNKKAAFTIAYANLGRMSGKSDQHSLYMSLQGTFN